MPPERYLISEEGAIYELPDTPTNGRRPPGESLAPQGPRMPPAPSVPQSQPQMPSEDAFLLGFVVGMLVGALVCIVVLAVFAMRHS
jgi:hypothetical protein